MKQIILVKYGELSTKGDNRHIFIKTLKNNIENTVQEKINIQKFHDRIYIETNQTNKVMQQLKNIFGIHAIALCYQTINDEAAIKETLLNIVNNNSKQTFKVKTKRANKEFPLTTPEINQKMGAYILKNSNLKVDVKNPELTITIEIRDNGTFIYTDEIKGLGGYPVGVQGQGILMLSGGLDSPVAAFLALKRGLEPIFLYFDSPPHTSEQAKNKVKELAKKLKKYHYDLKLYTVNFTKIQENIYQQVPHNYNVIIMRRMMYRIAEQFAKTNNAEVIITGESIGQVASQTIASLQATEAAINTLVIRPLACYDKTEIIELTKKIDTYETSIQPFIDCCTVFVPKHPVTKPTIKACLNYEQNLNFNLLQQVEIKLEDLNETTLAVL